MLLNEVLYTVINVIILNMHAACKELTIIYKPEGLRLYHTSAAREPTNGMTNFLSLAYQSNSGS